MQSYMVRVYRSRWVALSCALLGLVVISIVEYMVFTISLKQGFGIILVALVFSTIAFLVSWMASMMWKSNRDTMMHEMGVREMQKYQAALEQAIADREKVER